MSSIFSLIVVLPWLLFLDVSRATNRWNVIGNQISIAHYPSFFRTWTELATFVDDLVAFGGNFIEVAHVPDNSQGLPIDTLVNISQILHSRNVSCSFWWSNSLMDHHLADLPTLFSRAPQVDSIFFPGGDGGNLEWQTIAKTAKILRQHHPTAGIWVSAQEVNRTMLSTFFHDLKTNTTIQSILGTNGGAVYGPHNRVSLKSFVQELETTTIRQYPDLAHSCDAQFQIQSWDGPWAFSYGRQVVNPLPHFHSTIVLSRSNGTTPTIGVGAYSEGLNDDLNKFIWVAMAANKQLNVEDVVKRYSTYFFGRNASDDMTAGLFGLELNWKGKVHTNKERIENTLFHLEQGAKDLEEKNWRATMYLRRGIMDAYVYELSAQDLHLVTAVETILRTGSAASPTKCLDNVGHALTLLKQRHDHNNTKIQSYYARIVNLTAKLNVSIGANVLQTQDTFLNMKTIDSTQFLTSIFLESLLQNVTSASSCQRAVFNNWLEWEEPGSGGFYDNFGSVSLLDRSHLMNANTGNVAGDDPSCYEGCVIQGGSNVLAHVRPSWLRYSMVMYDNSMVIRYDNLDANATYQWEVVMWYCWFDCENDIVSFTANGVVIAENVTAANPMKKLELKIPKEALMIDSSGGKIEITCFRVPGLGGNGKTCQLSEAWLRRVDG